MSVGRILESAAGFVVVLLTVVMTVHAITGWDSFSWASWVLAAALVLIYGACLSVAFKRASRPLPDPMAHPHGDQPFTPKPLKRRNT